MVYIIRGKQIINTKSKSKHIFLLVASGAHFFILKEKEIIIMWLVYLIAIVMVIVGISPSNTSNVGWLVGGATILVLLISWKIAKKLNHSDD